MRISLLNSSDGDRSFTLPHEEEEALKSDAIETRRDTEIEGAKKKKERKEKEKMFCFYPGEVMETTATVCVC